MLPWVVILMIMQFFLFLKMPYKFCWFTLWKWKNKLEFSIALQLENFKFLKLPLRMFVLNLLEVPKGCGCWITQTFFLQVILLCSCWFATPPHLCHDQVHFVKVFLVTGLSWENYYLWIGSKESLSLFVVVMCNT